MKLELCLTWQASAPSVAAVSSQRALRRPDAAADARGVPPQGPPHPPPPASNRPGRSSAKSVTRGPEAAASRPWPAGRPRVPGGRERRCWQRVYSTNGPKSRRRPGWDQVITKGRWVRREPGENGRPGPCRLPAVASCPASRDEPGPETAAAVIIPAVARSDPARFRSGGAGRGCRDYSRRRALGSGPIPERRCGPGPRPPRARLSRSATPARKARPGERRRDVGVTVTPAEPGDPGRPYGRPPRSSPAPCHRKWDGDEIR
jgi:hypothetical protein